MSSVGCVKAPYWDLFLFIFFMNYVHLAIKYCEVHHIANDTNLPNFSSSVKSINK